MFTSREALHFEDMIEFEDLVMEKSFSSLYKLVPYTYLNRSLLIFKMLQLGESSEYVLLIISKVNKFNSL